MTEIFYHIDRWEMFSPGETLHTTHIDDWGPSVNSSLREFYPEGVSPHGQHYCTQNLYKDDPDDLWDFACEVLFELVRIADFPDQPSRFECLYGFTSRTDIEQFIDEVAESTYTLWEVRPADTFTADMNLVDAPDFARGLYRAQYYWEGETFLDEPHWETLLVPPVEIVEAVDIDEIA